MGHSLHTILLFLLFLPSSCLSHHTTNTFDVYASIQKTLNLQNPTTITTSNLSPSPKLSSSFSLSLRSRSSLSRYTDYNSLILSRLARDSARVASIFRSLSLLDPYAKLPLPSPNSLSAPVTSGQAEGSGEYFARVGVGRPVRTYYWVIDTGSDVTWLQCEPCASCYQQSGPIYYASGSSTYYPLSCDSAQCQALDESACFDNTCQYKVSYGDGSFTIGDFALETLSFGPSGSADDIALGCGHDNEGLFVGAAGLIGLGGGSLSLPSQLQATSFSYCLADGDSTNSSTLDFNSGTLTGSVTAALVHNAHIPTYRYVDLIGMSVGGRRLAISPSVFAVYATGQGGTIVDSGTSVTRLQAQAYEALRDEFVRKARNLKRTDGYELFDTCYDLSSTIKRQVAIPTVSFDFLGNQRLTIPPEGVLFAVDSNGKFCLAFAASNTGLSIIGNIQQQTTRVNFDLANSVVEFRTKSC